MNYTQTYDEVFWAYNLPVQLWTDEDTKKVSYVIYLPRKERCWNSSEDSEYIPKEELNTFIDNSIEVYENMIRLLKEFKEGKIDHIYYPNDGMEDKDNSVS